jgi:hypothetical protein
MVSGINLLCACLMIAGIIWWAASVEKAESKGDEEKKHQGFFAIKRVEAPKPKKVSGKEKTAAMFGGDYSQED